MAFSSRAQSSLAFYAKSFEGETFTEPTLMVMRSLDERPLVSSGRVRLYRAFGDREIRWNGKTVNIDDELVLSNPKP